MHRCLPNELSLFIQKAGYGQRLLFNNFSCQITFDDWKHSQCFQEDNGLVFKKYLLQTPLMAILFTMIHSSNTGESSWCKDTEMTNSLSSRSSRGFAWVNMGCRVRVTRSKVIHSVQVSGPVSYCKRQWFWTAELWDEAGSVRRCVEETGRSYMREGLCDMKELQLYATSERINKFTQYHLR